MKMTLDQYETRDELLTIWRELKGLDYVHAEEKLTDIYLGHAQKCHATEIIRGLMADIPDGADGWEETLRDAIEREVLCDGPLEARGDANNGEVDK